MGSLARTVSPGQVVTLDASPSTDPDGNALTFSWWQYYDADSATGRVTITNPTSGNGARFTVPNQPGRQIQVIVEVKDNGTPALTSYQRIIFTVRA